MIIALVAMLLLVIQLGVALLMMHAKYSGTRARAQRLQNALIDEQRRADDAEVRANASTAKSKMLQAALCHIRDDLEVWGAKEA